MDQGKYIELTFDSNGDLHCVTEVLNGIPIPMPMPSFPNGR